ncbi:unnamed protein product, partial [Mesorhabditis spiculigera]
MSSQVAFFFVASALLGVGAAQTCPLGNCTTASFQALFKNVTALSDYSSGSQAIADYQITYLNGSNNVCEMDIKCGVTTPATSLAVLAFMDGTVTDWTIRDTVFACKSVSSMAQGVKVACDGKQVYRAWTAGRNFPLRTIVCFQMPNFNNAPGLPNCAWGQWATISTCTATCGMKGQQMQQRECVSEAFGCPCTGAYFRNRDCPDAMCTFPDSTCADGYTKQLNTVKKKYTCQATTNTTDPPANPDFTCAMTETVPCPRVKPTGMWSNWKPVADQTCTATCGRYGTVDQVRTCLSTNVVNCTGITTRTIRCPQFPCPNRTCWQNVAIVASGTAYMVCPTSSCPADGGGAWGEWTSITACTAACGMKGQVSQQRTCVSETFGCPCNGATSQVIDCPPALCVAPATICATGYARKLNTATNTYTCQSTTPVDAPPANPNFSCARTQSGYCPRTPSRGIWSGWSTASGATCSATCGKKGTIAQTRTCLTSLSQPCTGISSRTITCPNYPCPDGSCVQNQVVRTYNINGELKTMCGVTGIEVTSGCYPNGCNYAPTSTTTAAPTTTTTVVPDSCDICNDRTGFEALLGPCADAAEEARAPNCTLNLSTISGQCWASLSCVGQTTDLVEILVVGAAGRLVPLADDSACQSVTTDNAGAESIYCGSNGSWMYKNAAAGDKPITQLLIDTYPNADDEGTGLPCGS